MECVKKGKRKKTFLKKFYKNEKEIVLKSGWNVLRKEKNFGFYYINFYKIYLDFKKASCLINPQKFEANRFFKKAKFVFLPSKRPNLATLLPLLPPLPISPTRRFALTHRG